MRKFTVAFCVAVLYLPMPVLAADVRPAKPELVIRIATVAPADIAYTKYMAQGMRAAEEKSKGRLKFELLAGGVAGDEPEIIEKLLQAKIEGAVVTVVGIQTIVPEMSALMLPYLFDDEDEFDHVVSENWDTLGGLFRAKGAEMVAFESIGIGEIFTSVPVHDLASLMSLGVWSWKGEKIWPRYRRFMGWSDSPALELKEVPAALQNGKVQLVFANAAGIVILGWYPHLCCWVRLSAIAAPAVLLTNRKFWLSTPDDLKRITLEEINRIVPNLKKWVRRDNEIAMLGLYKRGMKIIDLPPKDIETLRSRSREFWWEQADKLYPKWLLEKIMKDLEEYRAGRAK